MMRVVLVLFLRRIMIDDATEAVVAFDAVAFYTNLIYVGAVMEVCSFISWSLKRK